MKQEKVARSSKYFQEFKTLTDLDKQVQFNERNKNVLQANEARFFSKTSESIETGDLLSRHETKLNLKPKQSKIDKALRKLNKEMTISNKRF